MKFEINTFLNHIIIIIVIILFYFCFVYMGKSTWNIYLNIVKLTKQTPLFDKDVIQS